MMKKLSRIALLAAATAFLLGGVTACEHEDKSSSGSGGDNVGSGGGNTATVTFLSDIKGGSSSEPAEEGFFAGTKTGDLDVTISSIELQLYKSGTGWTAIDASKSSTKAATGANVEGVANVQGQLTTKNDAVANSSSDVLGEGGHEMGRVKISVTTGTSAVVLEKISGYFASGKSFTVGYVKVGDADFQKITETEVFTNGKGFKVSDFEVNQTIPANSAKDVYILLGKTATTAPSAGGTIDVAEVVLKFAAADSN